MGLSLRTFGLESKRRLKSQKFANCITLQDLCSNGPVASQWGLLGTISSKGKLKLAPRDGKQIAQDVQDEILRRTRRKVQVLIYGDGAYMIRERGSMNWRIR